MFLSFSPDYGNLNGSIAYLNNKEGSLFDFVIASASSSNVRLQQPINISSTNSFHASVRNVPQWYQVELKTSVLFITSYTIRSSGNPVNHQAHLKSWNFMGSLDRIHWDILDIQNNNIFLNGSMAFYNFECSQGLYRFFKIQQTGVGFSGEYGFGLRCIELFGSLFEGDYLPRILCPTYSSSLKHFHFSILTIYIIFQT